MATRREIREAIEAEIGHVRNSDLTAVINAGINKARRLIANLRGGKLKFLRAWGDLVFTANSRYSELPADARQVYFVWDVDNEAEIIFQDEHAYRQDADHFGYQPDSNTGDAPLVYLTDAPLASSGSKQIELMPIPNTSGTGKVGYWKRLPDLTDAEDTDEIYDVPQEHHVAIEEYARYYTLRHLRSEPDVLATARGEHVAAFGEVLMTEDDTTRRQLRLRSWAERVRQQHRELINMPEGEY